MSSICLACSSSGVRPLAAMAEGERGIVVSPAPDGATDGLRERLEALGVTEGAPIRVLQTFPGVVFLCDQSELVVERAIARGILVRLAEGRS